MREHCATHRPVPRGDLETQMESLCELVGYGHCPPPTLHRLHLFAPSRSSVLFRLFRNLATLVVAELRLDDALDATSFSSLPVAMSFTPCVLRPGTEMPFVAVRIKVPALVISITSSSSVTSMAPTTAPLRSLVCIEITP